ncbi:major facilitator superfamily protein [Caballeronia novacaledonica]|uniref:Major facilitator superfamily protein n=1 Tax=Caballeronia novacaledonica TaxID=1544861 RepID=A0A2U3IDE1_9BURK|nr:MFS transporter [Caballeronia novacaledonica]SPB18237.1 major facilitator superfamily protein [Caballeronia novacaledonica]
MLTLSTTLHTFAMVEVFAIPAMAPAMAHGLGVRESLVGGQVLVVYFAAMISSMFSGSLVARIGIVRATRLSLAGSGLGLGFAAIPSVAVTVVASALLGVSYGLANPATGAMLEGAAPPGRRAVLFSIKQSAVPIGGVIAGVLAPFLTVLVGWQRALLAIAALSIAGVLLLEVTRDWFPISEKHSARHGGRMAGDISLILDVTALKYTCLAGAVFAGVQLVLTTYLVPMLVRHTGLSLVAAGIGLSCFNAGGFCGRFAWGLTADAIKSGALALSLAVGVAVAMLLALPFVRPDWPIALIYFFLAVLGFVAAGWNGVFVSEIVRLAPGGDAARAIAGAFVFSFAGALTGVACFLLGTQWLDDYGSAIWMLSCMSIVGFLLSLKAFSAS